MLLRLFNLQIAVKNQIKYINGSGGNGVHTEFKPL